MRPYAGETLVLGEVRSTSWGGGWAVNHFHTDVFSVCIFLRCEEREGGGNNKGLHVLATHVWLPEFVGLCPRFSRTNGDSSVAHVHTFR